MSRCYLANDVLCYIFISYDVFSSTHIWLPWAKEVGDKGTISNFLFCGKRKNCAFLIWNSIKQLIGNRGGHYQRRGTPSTFYRNVYIIMFWLIQNNFKKLLWIWQNQQNVMTPILHFHVSNVSNVSCNIVMVTLLALMIATWPWCMFS